MAGAVRNSLQANPTCLLSRPCRIAKHLTIFFVSCQRSPHPGSPIRLLSPEHSQMIAINSPKPFSAVSAAAAAAALWPSLRRKPVAPPLEAAYSSMEWLDASPHDDFHLVVCLQKAAFARENATKKKLSVSTMTRSEQSFGIFPDSVLSWL
ncbi:hypothetical protein BC830DRAFT_1144736 [Chytriomyces sp. MP71]|nr:hypothetical protein BC830DRAFT_1144736 [Chytriomyces sp. MP71]